MLLRLFCCFFLPTLASSNGIETLIGITGKDFVLLAADTAVSTGGVALVGRDVDKITPLDTTAIAATGDPADTDRLTLQLVTTSRRKTYEAGPSIERFDCSTREQIVAILPPSTSACSVERVAAAARIAIVQRMRSRNPYRVSLLIAGMRESSSSSSCYDTTSTTTSTIAMNQALQQQLERASHRVHIRQNEGEQPKDNEDCGSEKIVSSLEDASDATTPPITSRSSPLLFWLDEYGAMQQVPYAVHGHAATLLMSLLDRGWRPDMAREEAQALLDSCLRLLEQRFLINTSSQFCIKCIDCTGCNRVDTIDN